MRMIMGLPGTGKLGAERRAIYTPAFMHSTERARSIGGWGNWRTLRKSVVADFVERIAGKEESIHSIHEISVIKFNSAERRNSYVEKPCHEQTDFLEKLRSQPDLLYHETLLALEHKLRGYEPISALAGAPDNPPPGWEISVYRKMRGLPADVPDSSAADPSPKAPGAERAVFHWTPENHDTFRTIGFHEPEKWNGSSFRWSSAVSVLEAPMDAGEYELGIVVLPLKTAQGLRLLINGVEAKPELNGNSIRVSFRQEVSGVLQLTLVAPGWYAPGDTRRLGVAVSDIFCASIAIES